MRYGFGAAAVCLVSAGAFAQAPPLTLAVYSGQRVPGAPPWAAFTDNLSSVVVGDNGDIAFSAELPNYRGTYVWRDGVVSPLTVVNQPAPGPLGTAVGDDTLAMPVAINGNGDILVRGTGRIDSTQFAAVWVYGPSGNVLRLRGGDPLPGIGARTFSSWPLFSNGFTTVRRLFDDRSFVMLASVAPASIGSISISSAVVSLDASSVLLRASVGSSGAMLGSAQLLAFNNSGECLVYGRRSGETTLQTLLANESGIHELIRPGQPAPGFPGFSIFGHMQSCAVAPDGTCAIAARLAPGTPVYAAVWMGTPGSMAPVLREGELLVPQVGPPLRVSLLPLQNSQQLRFSSAGSVDAVVMLEPPINTPGPWSIGIVRCSIGEPPRVIFDSRESIRNIPEATISPFGHTYSVPGDKRIVFAANLFRPGQPTCTALITQDEGGAPYAVIVGGSTASHQDGTVRTLPRSLSSFGSEPGSSLWMTESGHIAIHHSFADGSTGIVTASVLPAQCGDLDFNNDGLYPDNTDLTHFLAVFGGAACPTHRCDSIDFNRDGLFPDNADISAFFSVFGGGPCE
jgi:hypothetical protein